MRKELKNPEKRRYGLSLTPSYVNALDLLIESGIYDRAQEAIREAMRDFFIKKGIAPFSDFVQIEPETTP